MQLRSLNFCWIFSFIFFLGCGAAPQSAPGQQAAYHAGASNLSSTSRSAVDLSQFVGTWTAHGAALVIARDGTATFTARAYRWCGSGVPQPCDTIDTQDRIHDGNQEQLQLTRFSGSVAYGTVTTSTFHPAGLAVTLTLQPNDTLLYAGNAPISLLCGPAAPVGTCGA